MAEYLFLVCSVCHIIASWSLLNIHANNQINCRRTTTHVTSQRCHRHFYLESKAYNLWLLKQSALFQGKVKCSRHPTVIDTNNRSFSFKKCIEPYVSLSPGPFQRVWFSLQNSTSESLHCWFAIFLVKLYVCESTIKNQWPFAHYVKGVHAFT